MLARNRKLTVLTAASYLLAITVSALFHNHDGHGNEQPQPGVSAAHSADDHDCSVCQFLAQKPAPAADVTPVDVGALVQEVAAPAPVCTVGVVFTAWHSRAPPVLA
jgi:hypothetical protein